LFEYQKNSLYFGLLADGMEDLGESELLQLGATRLRRAFRGMFFHADISTMYRINYLSRFFTRILAPLITFDCHSDKYLYRTASLLNWSDILSPDDTFAIFSSVSDSNIRHSRFASLRLKDAIADWFVEHHGRRPNVDTESPDVWINLRIHGNKACIRLDTSGGSLHRRGYRARSVEAPMQETLASAIIQLSGWDGSTPFYDPMCGSGTLLCEALMHYCRIPAGYLRKRFGFYSMPEFDSAVWQKIRKAENSRIRSLPRGMIGGSDISEDAISIARGNCDLLPSGKAIGLRRCDYHDLEGFENATIVTNPPYGLRLKRGEDLSGFMKEFGDFLKFRCAGSVAYVYFGKRDLLKRIGLRSSWKKPLKNGRLDGRLARYELY